MMKSILLDKLRDEALKGRPAVLPEPFSDEAFEWHRTSLLTQNDFKTDSVLINWYLKTQQDLFSELMQRYKDDNLTTTENDLNGKNKGNSVDPIHAKNNDLEDLDRHNHIEADAALSGDNHIDADEADGTFSDDNNIDTDTEFSDDNHIDVDAQVSGDNCVDADAKISGDNHIDADNATFSDDNHIDTDPEFSGVEDNSDVNVNTAIKDKIDSEDIDMAEEETVKVSESDSDTINAHVSPMDLEELDYDCVD